MHSADDVGLGWWSFASASRVNGWWFSLRAFWASSLRRSSLRRFWVVSCCWGLLKADGEKHQSRSDAKVPTTPPHLCIWRSCQQPSNAFIEKLANDAHKYSAFQEILYLRLDRLNKRDLFWAVYYAIYANEFLDDQKDILFSSMIIFKYTVSWTDQDF